MRALVVYESMSGTTEAVARGVADGLRTRLDVVAVVPTGAAVPEEEVADEAVHPRS